MRRIRSWRPPLDAPRPLESDAPIDYVEIIGDHPHAGKRGKLVAGTAPETLQCVRLPSGEPMALIEFDDGEGRCYAARRNLRIVSNGRSYFHHPKEGA